MENYFTKVIDAIVSNNDVIKATKYVSPKQVVRAVRTTYRCFGRKPRKGDNIQITLTIGKPNYLEREFIKLCTKAKEPFPVRAVILKLYNPKKKVAKKRS
jgi:hypothetical protein